MQFGLTAPPEGAQWSGDFPIPNIGDIINVTMNRLGLAEVKGYWEDEGWLGVEVRFNDPPDWWLRQNADNPTRLGTVFGAECSAR